METVVLNSKLSFKDFMTVDYAPGQPEQISWNAKKRRRGVIGEALSMQARRKRAQVLRRIKSKLAMGRKRFANRAADPKRLMKRARKLAINLLYKKLAKGVPREELGLARRQEIEKRLEKMKGRIERMARKLLPKVRQFERDRRQGKSTSSSKMHTATE